MHETGNFQRKRLHDSKRQNGIIQTFDGKLVDSSRPVRCDVRVEPRQGEWTKVLIWKLRRWVALTVIGLVWQWLVCQSSYWRTLKTASDEKKTFKFSMRVLANVKSTVVCLELKVVDGWCLWHLPTWLAVLASMMRLNRLTLKWWSRWLVNDQSTLIEATTQRKNSKKNHRFVSSMESLRAQSHRCPVTTIVTLSRPKRLAHSYHSAHSCFICRRRTRRWH